MQGRHASTLPRRRPLRLVLAVAALAAALATGAFSLIREVRLDASAAGAVREARSRIAFAAQNLPPDPSPNDLQFVRGELINQEFDAVIVPPRGPPVPTLLSLDIEQVPPALRQLVRSGLLAYQRTTVADTPHVVVGGPASTSEVYLFFSEAQVRGGITALAFALLVGWAGLVGLTVAATMAGLQSRLSALAEARSRERRFTSDVAHELRTPLAALVGEASLLRDHLDRMPPEARRPAELLVHDVGRLRRLVEELMEISRLDAGGESLLIEPVELGTLVQAVLRSRGWEGLVRVEGASVAIHSDRRRVESIAANLIGNAVEHGGEDVRVGTGHDGDEALLEVSDRGPGIPAEALAHLFDRFYKADPSRAGGGTGLGLAIARENARLLGGDIDVESLPGAGTRFTLRLPLTSGGS